MSKPLNPIRAADIRASEMEASHPWNLASKIRGQRLGHMAGPIPFGVNLLRIAPDHESFVYHVLPDVPPGHSHRC